MKEVASQHAYQPKKSTYTAWQELYPLLLKEPNVYEFDLKGFFDNVDLSYNQQEMLVSGIPESISEYLTTLNKSIVKLKEEDEVDESEHRMVI